MTALIALNSDERAALAELTTATKQAREAESHAGRVAAFAKLKTRDDNGKAIQAAAAAKAKAGAKIAKAQADVAVATSEAAEAHYAWYALVEQDNRDLRRLRLAAMDRDAGVRARSTLLDAFEAFRADSANVAIGKAGKTLTNALHYINAAIDAASDPPEDIEQWLADTFAAFESAKPKAHAEHEAKRDALAREDRARKLTF